MTWWPFTARRQSNREPARLAHDSWSANRLPAEPWNQVYVEQCTETDVYSCFRLLLGRQPSRQEWPWHRNHAGQKLSEVVALYVSSREFKNRSLITWSDADYELVDLPNFRMYVSASDIAVGRHILAVRAYEPHVTRHMMETLRPGMVFVDVGANIGYFTLLGAHLIGPLGKVIAFEPFQSNVKLLYLNAALNGYSQVAIHPFAVADRNGLLAYDNTASNGVISEPRPELGFLQSTTLVPAVRLDDLLGTADRIDAIKLDIEGAEYRALEGAARVLRTHRPHIYSEFSPPALSAVSGATAEAYLQRLLVDEGYCIDVLDRDGTVASCGRDLSKVIEWFERDGTDHIDVLARPIDAGHA